MDKYIYIIFMLILFMIQYIISQTDLGCQWKKDYYNKIIRIESVKYPGMYLRSDNQSIELQTVKDEESLFYVVDGFVNGKNPLTRYVKLARADNLSIPLNILEIAVYDINNNLITNKVTPTIFPQFGDISTYGPQYLIDQTYKLIGPGFKGIAQSGPFPNAFMQLDLGQDIEISKVIIYNRQDCCWDRIFGTSITLTSNSNEIIYSRPINSIQYIHEINIPFGKCSLSFMSIKYPNFYIKNQNNQLQLRKIDQNDYNRLDSSFLITSFVDIKKMAFISLSYPASYIRTCAFHLYVDDNNRNNIDCDKRSNVFYQDVLYYTTISTVNTIDNVIYYPVFKDDFEDNLNDSNFINNSFIIKNWKSISGSLNIAGSNSKNMTNIKCIDGSTKCMAIVGSKNVVTIIETIDYYYSTYPRTCRLSYFLSRLINVNVNMNSTSPRINITIYDNFINMIYSTDGYRISNLNTNFSNYKQTFTIPPKRSIKIRIMYNSSQDNNNIYIDNINLACTLPLFNTIFTDPFENENNNLNLTNWMIIRGSVDLVGPMTLLTQYTCNDFSKQCIFLKLNNNDPTGIIMRSKKLFFSKNNRTCRLKYSLAGSFFNLNNQFVMNIIDNDNNNILYYTDNGIILSSNASWTDYDATFTVPANKTAQIQFLFNKLVNNVSINNSINNGILLDDIQLQCAIFSDDNYDLASLSSYTEIENEYKLLFNENFELQENIIDSKINKLDNWNITNGSIDLIDIYNPLYSKNQCSQNSFKCINIPGNLNNLATIETNQEFLSFQQEIYILNYAISINRNINRTDRINNMFVSIVDDNNKSIVYSTDNGMIINQMYPFQVYSQIFNIPAGKTFKIQINTYINNTNINTKFSDNTNILLDDISLYSKQKFMSCLVDNSKIFTFYEFDIQICLLNNETNVLIQRINEFTRNIFQSLSHIARPYIRSSVVGCNICNFINDSFPCVNGNTTYLIPPSLPVRTLGVCNTDSSCNELKTKYLNKRYNAILQIKNGINKLVSNDINKSLLCPFQVNSLSVTYYDDFNDRIACRCQCPVGNELKKTADGYKCVEKENTIQPLECEWSKKCFFYEQKSKQLNQCNMNQLVSSNIINSIPLPNDKTNLLYNNNITQIIDITGPRIVIYITRNDSNNIGIETWRKTYSWSAYKNDQLNIFNNDINFNKIGLYRINIEAYDYASEPIKCFTTLLIQDSFYPEANPNTICPMIPSYPVLSYTKDNYQYLQDNLNNFTSWINKIENDACGENNRCDSYNYTRTNFGSNSLINEANIMSCFDIRQDDLIALASYMNQSINLTLNHPLDYTNNFCTKCCNLSFTAKEQVNKWNCPIQNSSFNSPFNQQCVGNIKTNCNWNSCLVANTGLFFNASVSLKTNIITENNRIINENFQNNYYRSTEEIHVLTDCNNLDISCLYKAKLGDLFDINATLSLDWNLYFTVSNFQSYTALDYVKFRYRLDKESWKIWDPNNEILFVNLLSYITFEAYSPCGPVLSSIIYNVYQHPQKKLNICDMMVKTAWNQISRRDNQLNDSIMCNYPNSDFAEFTFEFNPLNMDFSSTLSGYTGYKYESVECQIAYKFNDESYTPYVTIINPTKQALVEHYGVKLMNHSVIAALSTELQMICNLNFIQSNGSFIREKCIKNLSFKNCDSPSWYTPTADCKVGCLLENIPVENQMCGGNMISSSFINNSLQTNFISKYQDNLSCCQICGKTECMDIYDGTTKLKQCILSDNEVKARLLMSVLSDKKDVLMNMLQPFISTIAAILGILGLISGIVYKTYKNRKHSQIEKFETIL